MKLQNPNIPGGELIADSLADLGITISAAAKVLGITRQLHNLVAGRSAITAEMAVKLEMAIGSTAGTWLRMQMRYDLAQVRERDFEIRRFIAT